MCRETVSGQNVWSSKDRARPPPASCGGGRRARRPEPPLSHPRTRTDGRSTCSHLCDSRRPPADARGLGGLECTTVSIGHTRSAENARGRPFSSQPALAFCNPSVRRSLAFVARGLPACSAGAPARLQPRHRGGAYCRRPFGSRTRPILSRCGVHWRVHRRVTIDTQTPPRC